MVAEKQYLVASESKMMTRKGLPLCSVTKGSRLMIVDIPQGRGRTLLIRLGIMKGEIIQCVERLPGGTVVIEKNRQEIAIGASLAMTILVDCDCADQPSKY